PWLAEFIPNLISNMALHLWMFNLTLAAFLAMDGRVSRRVCKYRNVEKSESVSNPMYRMAIMAMVPRDYNHNKNWACFEKRFVAQAGSLELGSPPIDILGFQRVPRTGCAYRSLEKPESVSSHVLDGNYGDGDQRQSSKQGSRVPRTGWLYRNLENPESVSDLIYQMAIMAMGDQTQPSQQELG
ncbi:hypothetical protein STEG23_011296, partial [Scotinomys teguina]